MQLRDKFCCRSANLYHIMFSTPLYLDCLCVQLLVLCVVVSAPCCYAWHACIPLHSACRYHLHLPVGFSTASTLSSVMLEPPRCLHLVGDVNAAPPAQSRSQACSEMLCLHATVTICTYVRTSCILASSFTKLHTSVLSLQLGHRGTLEQLTSMANVFY